MRRYEDKLFMAGGHNYDSGFYSPPHVGGIKKVTLYILNKSENKLNIEFSVPPTDAMVGVPVYPFNEYQNTTAIVSSAGTTSNVTLGSNKEDMAYNATAYECYVTNLETIYNYGFGPVKGQVDYILNQYNLFTLGGYVSSIYNVVLASENVSDYGMGDPNLDYYATSSVRHMCKTSKGTIHNYGEYPFFLEYAHEIDSPVEYPQFAKLRKTSVGQELMQETNILGPRINGVGDSHRGHNYKVPTLGVEDYAGVDDLVNIGIAFQYKNDVLKVNGEPIIYEVLIQVDMNEIWSPQDGNFAFNDLIGQKLQDEFLRKYGSFWIYRVVSFITSFEHFDNTGEEPTIYEWVPFCIKPFIDVFQNGVDSNDAVILTRSIVTRFITRPPITTKYAKPDQLISTDLPETTTPEDIVKGKYLENLVFLPNHEFEAVSGINTDPSIGFINLARINTFNCNNTSELDARQPTIDNVEAIYDAVTIMGTVDALNHKPTLYSYLTEEEKLLSENWSME